VKKRVEMLSRLSKLQDQRLVIRQVELAAASRALTQLHDERELMYAQIDDSTGHHRSILDVIFRRLDRLSGLELELKAKVKTIAKLKNEDRRRLESCNRAKEGAEEELRITREKEELVEIVERLGRESTASFR
jgi:hypothetical protein